MWVFTFLRYFFRALWYGLMLMFTSVVAIARGVPSTTDDIADDWALRFVEAGGPTQHAPLIRRTVKLVATIAVIVGWILLAYFTVFVIGRFF